MYAPRGANLLVQDSRMPDSQYRPRKIEYYAAVNAVIGPVWWAPCTGCSADRIDGKWVYPEFARLPYTVGACLAASNVYEPVYITKWQWGFSCTCCTARCIRLPHCLSS